MLKKIFQLSAAIMMLAIAFALITNQAQAVAPVKARFVSVSGMSWDDPSTQGRMDQRQFFAYVAITSDGDVYENIGQGWKHLGNPVLTKK